MTIGQNIYASNTMVKCYHCIANGHKSKVFPTWKMVNFVDAIEDEDDVSVEPNEDYEEHIIDRDCYIIHQGKKNTLIDIVSFA